MIAEDTMTLEQNWATLAARLASFETTLPLPAKKRASNAKGLKTISWPHKHPSPAELARAGFYYKPSVHNRDNTHCFLCDRALDGWEEDDDPVVEHLKHSPNCGWAIILNSTQNGIDNSRMEDPTEARLAEARKATFAIGWPHDGKRGWTCKTEKMVAAGWHFAPTQESEDFVSCAYCKLSLDGWEPKDDPFDEHYRRSPDCLFFTFAGTTAPKATKGKKARHSKATRLSTQSSLGTTSEVLSIPDLDVSIDASFLSVDSTASTTSAMGNNKNTKGRSRATRPKRARSISEFELEPSTVASDESQKPSAQPKRGRKRANDHISEDERGCRESTVKPEPPPKRINANTSTGAVEVAGCPALEVELLDEGAPELVTSMGGGGKKRIFSRTRKISKSPRISTASPHTAVPDNATLDAALEADLDVPMSDAEPIPVIEKTTRTKPSRTKSGKTSVARTRNVQADPDTQDVPDSLGQSGDARLQGVTAGTKSNVSVLISDTLVPKKFKQDVTKNPATEQPSSADIALMTAKCSEFHVKRSEVSDHAVNESSRNESDVNVPGKPVVRKEIKRTGTGEKVTIGFTAENAQHNVQQQSQSQTVVASAQPNKVKLGFAGTGDAAVANSTEENVETNKPVQEARNPPERPDGVLGPAESTSKAKNTGKQKGSKSKKKQAENPAPHLSMPGAFSPPVLEEEIEPSFSSIVSPNAHLITMAGSNTHHQALPASVASPLMASIRTQKNATPPLMKGLPPPRAPSDTVSIMNSGKVTQPIQPGTRRQVQKETTPSPSPQSSDAENAPPSSRLPSSRLPLAPLSASKQQPTRVPFEPGTPIKAPPISPSKIGGGLISEIPWTMVDVEMAFLAAPGAHMEDPVRATRDWPTGLKCAEKEMTVEDWIYQNAKMAEETLRTESERVVGVFEREGGLALKVLEGLEVIEH